MGWFSGAYMTVESHQIKERPKSQRSTQKCQVQLIQRNCSSLFAEWTRASKPAVTGSLALNKSATRGGLIKTKRKAAE